MNDCSASKFQELFKSSGIMQDDCSLDWKSLPAFVRVLLATDGTVTKSLEAYFWEPISVNVQHQGSLSVDTAKSDFADLNPQTMWSRDVMLVGQESKRCFAKASSQIAYSTLPKRLREALAKGELGIGEIIRDLGLETYRKIVAVGAMSDQGSGCDLVWRVYHIFYQGQILMRIREEFDLSAFESKPAT